MARASPAADAAAPGPELWDELVKHANRYYKAGWLRCAGICPHLRIGRAALRVDTLMSTARRAARTDEVSEVTVDARFTSAETACVWGRLMA